MKTLASQMTRALVMAALCLASLHAATAAETIFTDVPAWVSAVEDTRDVALGDVDGDGDLDLVRASIDQATTLYLNIGGVFADVPAWSGPVEPTRSLALGDVDGDGDLDLVRGNTGQGATLYLNTGGIFETTPAWRGLPELTRAIALGDVDGDGDLDLVRGNLNQGSTVYLNVNGLFEDAPAWTGPPASTNAVALGDVNGDGRLDLVLGNFNQPSGLFLNTGTLFAATPDWTGPVERTRGVALGDVDNDGDFDLVRGNLGAGATLTLNTGGLFEDLPLWTSPAESTWAVALGDVDDDGQLDLVRGNSERGTTLYLNIGATFADTPFWSGPVQDNRSVALGDVDGDGDLDLVRGNLDQATTLHLNVSGLMSLQPVWSGRPEETRALAVGDVDGDGDLDLVRGNLGGGTTLYRNSGGTLDTLAAWIGPLENTLAVALGDIDSDGDLDLLRGNFDQGATLYRNEGGTFGASPLWTGPTETTTSIALGDVNGDGQLDLVRGNLDQAATLYLNQGGTFGATPDWTGPVESTRSVALGDVDSDGDLDLVRGNFDQGPTLYVNVDGTFESAPSWTGPVERTTSITLGDVDGDGQLDLVRGNLDQSATLTLNVGGTFAAAPVWSGPVEKTVSVTLGDLDGDGDLDLVRGNLDGPSSIHLNEGAVFEALPVASVGDDSTWSASLADLDADGDLDALLGKTSTHANRSPWLTGNTPSKSLPNNAAHLRWVATTAGIPNEYRIGFQAVDIEGDPLWIAGEYQFAGAPAWYPMAFAGVGPLAGPFAASRDGVSHELAWDVIQLPFDRRSIVVRLHTLSSPRRAGEIAFAPAYLQNVGRVVPVRPSFAASPSALVFPTITLGDSAEVSIRIANRGNRDLVIEDIESPAPEIEVLAPRGLTIPPGDERDVSVRLAPLVIPQLSAPIRITANDPANPQVEIDVIVDVRELDFETQLLAVAPELPLGEAATVVVTPGDQVRIEDGFLFFRHRGVSTFADSARLVPQGSNFIALAPSESVTEAGLEYYVRVENSGVTRVDPRGAPDSTFFFPVASPAGVVASAVPNARGLFVEGSETPIVASLPQGSAFVEGMLYYAAGGRTALDSVALVLTEVSPGIVAPAATIPGEIVGPRGVEYRVRIRTLTTTLSDPSGPLSATPKTIRVTVGSLAESVTHPANAYRPVSAPLDLELPPTSSLEAILSDQPEFGPANITRWRAFRYLPASGEYLEVTAGAEDARLRPRPGRAFWLIASSPNAIDTAPVPGLSTPTGAPYRVTLQPGWNLIGNPYVFPVAWSDVVAQGTSGLVLLEPPVAWDEAAGQYRDADVETLVPFEGYWLWNPEAGAVDLVVPPIATRPAGTASFDALEAENATRATVPEAAKRAGGNATRATVPEASKRAGGNATRATAPEPAKRAGDSGLRGFAADPAWRIRIEVRALDRADRRNFAGVVPGAAEGYDAFDRTDPPMSPGGGISLYFLEPDSDNGPRRTADMRSPIEPHENPEAHGRRWVFDVMRSGEGPSAIDAHVGFEDLDRVPDDLEVRLLDRALARVFDLRREARISFVSNRKTVARASQARFELLVGTAAFVNAAAERNTVRPHRTQLHPSYPNPIVSATTVRFEIAQAGPVRLDVFDIAGRRVRELVRGNFEAGLHELSWAGRDDLGRSLAPGVYTLRLVAASGTDAFQVVKIR